jgi:CBS domain containing-hemolysin-like protein
MNTTALWVALLSATLGGLMAALQFSLTHLSRSKVRRVLAARKKPVDMEPILDDPDDYALALAVPRLVFSLITVAAAVVWSGGIVSDAGVIRWAWVVTAVGVAAALLFVVGVSIPQSVAAHAGEPLVVRMRWLVRFVHFFMRPIVRACDMVDEIVRRLVGAQAMTDEQEMEEELRTVVSESEEEGRLDESERDMIEAVVEMRTTAVSEIMLPRTEIEGFELTDDLSFITGFIRRAGHSRIPVFEGDLDHIIGVLYAKDLLEFVGAGTESFKLRPILREAQFIPETKSVRDVLAEFKTQKVHMSIVLDEYGGTAGLVTIEDVLEELVGDIQDEYEPEHESAPEISVVAGSRSAEVDARAYIDDVNDALEEIGLSIPDEDEYDTVGGFVLSTLGRIPAIGESFRANGVAVLVLEAEPTRVMRVRIESAPEEHGHEEDAPTVAK